MGLDVVDADEGQARAEGEALGDAEADQQGADEARAVGDGDRVDGVEAEASLLEARVEDGEGLVEVGQTLKIYSLTLIVKYIL